MADILRNPSRMLRKQWGAEKVHKYIGNFKKSWFAYSSSEKVREKAASGGVITALLSYLLKEGEIDGALVCRSVIVDGKVRPQFFIAEDENALLIAQGSKYIAVDFNQDALPLIREFKGRLAVVALPCDTTHLRHACENDPQLKEKVSQVITLFCGHNSRPELTDLVTRKLTKRNATLTGFHYRQGHWRGSLRAEFDNGKQVEKPFSNFSVYQNLYFYCQQKCHHCNDHTGYHGDISVGDIWSLRMKENPIKHNAVITRTPVGAATFQRAVDADVITASPERIDEICEGQARSMPFHYNTSARAKAGKLLGIKIKDTVYERVRWNEFLVAWIVLFNEKLSRSSGGQKLIRRTPRFLLKLYLYLMKGLESI
ncbi:MAG: Coenzyme F420 hydrogenase/dehydrogenase, beta subunit C-terminal domain [Pelolinea sp.]|nr:Coenzyme F420 hydrogenase/dehydrogenase, beta subunit C-terminal domain [Pelolinea sp.]